MHIITILRAYLEETQPSLANRAGITPSDLSEIETRPPYGSIEKFKRLSDALGVPAHTLVSNDCTGVPASFFDSHPPKPYIDRTTGIGRDGEEYVYRMEKDRLSKQFETLDKLVLPFFKMRKSAKGYDILSFDDNGHPMFIEVKTTKACADHNYHLTVNEYEVAQKLTNKGCGYFVYYLTCWGTKKQQLHKIPFRDMIEGHRITPTCYTCSTKDRPDRINGITYCRRMRGLTQTELAARLNIMQTHLCRYETEVRSCSVETYQKLSVILEVTIDQLLDTYPADSQVVS